MAQHFLCQVSPQVGIVRALDAFADGLGALDVPHLPCHSETSIRFKGGMHADRQFTTPL